jgi:hypothetical protein
MWNHHVILTELKENTRYYYRCGDPVAGWSKEYYFQVSTPQKQILHTDTKNRECEREHKREREKGTHA